MDVEKLKRELREDEGFVPHAYKDSLGFDTIGIGRLCDKRRAGSGLTEDEAMYLLGNDIAKRHAELLKRLPWFSTLSDARQRALLNMSFQLGVDGLLSFKNTLAMMRDGRFEDAANNAMRSLWAKQTPNRAKRVTDMIRRG